MVDKIAITKAAQKFIEKGQIDKAIAEWEKLLKESPDGNVYNTIGDLYLRRNQKREAIEAFAKAANIFREDGFYLKAIGLYRKILNISTSDTDALVALAELNAEKGLVGNANQNLLAVAEKFNLPSIPSLEQEWGGLVFPRPMINSGDFNFSFSGLKTSVLYKVQKMTKAEIKQRTSEICFEFQEAVIDILTTKTIKAAVKHQAKTILMAGGVAANKNLRESLQQKSEANGFKFLVPDFSLCTDNAGMIAVAGYYLSQKDKPAPNNWKNIKVPRRSMMISPWFALSGPG